MKNKLLIIPGYLAGIGCLFIVTYSLLLAFFSDSKSVTIYVNRFGEQYVDVLVLVFIWIVCLVGLRYLFLLLKKDKESKGFGVDFKGRNVLSEDGVFLGVLSRSLFDEKTGLVSKLLIEPSDDVDLGLYQVDGDGNILVSFSSIDFVDNDIVVR